MITETFHLELITPCFCGGAEPEKQAEIRAPSIRGQLRWWFRTLDGFKSLAPMPVRDQEALIFGSTAGDEGRAGKLVVRIGRIQVDSAVRDGQELGHINFSDPAYLTFPVQSREKQGQKTNYAGRGVLLKGSFDLSVQWRGDAKIWPDIQALVVVFGNLGALGFRSRRALGALHIASQAAPPDIKDIKDIKTALDRFGNPKNPDNWRAHIEIRKVTARPPNQPIALSNANDCIVTLARWLKDWRSHGRTKDHPTAQSPNPPHNSGFRYAKNDHDQGVDVGRRQGNPNDQTYRPALGLPIIQFFSSGKPQVDWNERWDQAKAQRSRNYKGEGRFASPVLLRPHRDAAGQWHALVIFLDVRQWPGDKPVFLNGQERRVSLDLYKAMKKDPRLQPFP